MFRKKSRAFANDFNETGGGYIVVGVKEVNGRPVRPVIGIDPDQIESIEKEMVGYNNLMRPYYQPRLYIEEADGKTILVIKVSAGERRPYKVPDCVTAKQKVYNYYIRYNSSSIVPKDEYERELINLANRTPFDDRRSRNRYSYHSGRAESQRLVQSDYRDRRGADLFPDRYSLPSGIYQREGCLEQGLHKFSLVMAVEKTVLG